VGCDVAMEYYIWRDCFLFNPPSNIDTLDALASTDPFGCVPAEFYSDVLPTNSFL